MEIKELLAEGKSKKVYATSQSDQVIVEFQDGAGAKSKKKGEGEKSAVNNAISAYLFEYLESYNVPTHFVKVLDAKSFLAKRLEIVPMSIRVYNFGAAELAERLGIDAGKILEFPVVEMYLKGNQANPMMINEYHAYALGLCDRKEMTSIMRIATKVNAVLKSFFDRKRLKLVSLEMEFGRQNNQVFMADEVSLETLALAKIDDDGEMEALDKISNHDINDYQEIQSRILGTS